MINSEMPEFIKFMNTITEYYGKDPLSGMIIEIYFNGLSDYSFDQVKGATSKHMTDPANGQFLPKIADIKKHIDGGVMSADSILAAARMRSTPLGILCLIQIGTYDLEHQSDMFYLKQRAQECIDLLPEWRERAVLGDYSDHEIRTMLKHKVNPEKPFYTGLQPPSNYENLVSRAKKIWFNEFDGKEEEPKQLTQEECKTLPAEGIQVLKELFERVDEN